MRKNRFKLNQLFGATRLLAVVATVGLLALTFQTQLPGVSAVVLPITVNKDHINFDVSFPGEQRETTFTVSYSGSGEPTDYAISMARKPLPPEHPQYPSGGDPDMPGYYRNLCPHLAVTTSEGEGGTLSLSFVDDTDTADLWTVTLDTPAIDGFIGQTHSGGIVSTNGEYGCDLVFEVIETPQSTCGDGIIDTGETCDGIAGVAGHQRCSDTCQLENLTYCGDGAKQTPNDEGTGGPANDGVEGCDNTDGVTSGHVCSQTCVLEALPPPAHCGDGVRNQIAEECDGTDGVTTGFTCASNCTLQEIPITPICGDGIKNQESEQCDGNDGVTAGHFCTSGCLLEADGVGGACTDIDEDSYAAEGGQCGAVDCNDNDGAINPGASEICDDGIDNNCDGLIDGQDVTACPTETQLTSTTGGGGGGGGGGGSSGPYTLYIHSEHTIDATTNTITITWFTNHPATSRVVYDTISHPVIGFPPNYGYAFSNVEDPALTLFHSMIITGLTSDTVYYFRPISHGSPEVYGIELTKATTPPGEGGEPIEPGTDEGGTGTGGPTDSETTGEGGAGIVAGVELGNTGSGAPTGETGTVLGLAIEEAADVAGTGTPPINQPTLGDDQDRETPAPCAIYIWLLLVLNAIAAGAALWRERQGAKSPIPYGWLIGLLLAVIPVIIWYPACWLVTWLIITLIALIIVIAMTTNKDQSQNQTR